MAEAPRAVSSLAAMWRSSPRRWLGRGGALALFGALVSGLACEKTDDGGEEGNSGTAGTGGTILSSTGGVGAGIDPDFVSKTEVGEDGMCRIVPDESGCAGTAYEPEHIPLDIFVMFDQSGSMCICVDPPKETAPSCPDPDCSKSRLEAIEAAVTAFMAEPDSAGIGMALGFFGDDPLGSASCDAADYTDAAVPFGALPGQAPAITAALAGAAPTGETPTGAAIRGACVQAAAQRAAEPAHKVVVLLVTDGEPKAPVTCPAAALCCPSVPDAAAAAAECLEAEAIPTYVLGVGPFLSNLGALAESGGTHEAYLIEGGDVTAQVLDALGAIRDSAIIPCELPIPDPPAGQDLSYDRVNLVYADAACDGAAFGRVAEVSQCPETGGWYYDDPTAPTTIELCPTTCDQVSAPGGSLLMQLGCETVEIR